MKQDSIFQRYDTRYLFYFYDITTTRNPDNVSESSATWERGAKDARTTLHLLSKGVSVVKPSLMGSRDQ